MPNVPKQIIGSFEDIGKDVAREAMSVPKDVLGSALESLTGQGSKKQAGAQQGPLQEFDKTKDEKAKKAIARSALEWISGKRAQPKELGVREKLDKEEAEKQKQIKEQKEKAQKAQLLEPTLHEKRGNLPGMTRQKAGSETSRNVRQD